MKLHCEHRIALDADRFWQMIHTPEYEARVAEATGLRAYDTIEYRTRLFVVAWAWSEPFASRSSRPTPPRIADGIPALNRMPGDTSSRISCWTSRSPPRGPRRSTPTSGSPWTRARVVGVTDQRRPSKWSNARPRQ